MKKILCLLVLLLSLTVTCAAFNPPQPPRWYWIGSNAHYGTWIDTATARFYIGSENMRIEIINVRLYGWNGMTQIKMNMLFHMMNMTSTAEW